MSLSGLLARTLGRGRSQSGMTLVEIMIVIVILAGLTALLAPRVTSQLNHSNIKQTYLAMSELGKALDTYNIDCGKYPSTAQGLKALLENPGDCPAWVEPYVKKNLLKDAWGTEFQYEEADGVYTITSFGADKKPGGTGKNKDLTNHDGDDK